MPNPASRAVETLAPSRLGRSFRWLLASSTITNAGDGVVLAAGPLLVASLTRDPFLVSLAVLMVDLPMLLFALIGGVAADRYDRRRMVIRPLAVPRPADADAGAHDLRVQRDVRRRVVRPHRARRGQCASRTEDGIVWHGLTSFGTSDIVPSWARCNT